MFPYKLDAIRQLVHYLSVYLEFIPRFCIFVGSGPEYGPKDRAPFYLERGRGPGTTVSNNEVETHAPGSYIWPCFKYVTEDWEEVNSL